MIKLDWSLRLTLAVIAVCLSVMAFREVKPRVAYAAEARFDHVAIVSAAFIYKGEPGLLLLDKRNGNVWYMGHKQAVFDEPVLLGRVPFEKLDVGTGAQ